MQESNWTFRDNGRQWLSRYIAAVKYHSLSLK
jgi:hypothetical protein